MKKMTNDEQYFIGLPFYQQNCEFMKSMDNEELKSLLEKAKTGDQTAKGKIIEGYMLKVVDIAKKCYESQKAAEAIKPCELSELVEIGNLVLVEVVADHSKYINKDTGLFRQYITKAIKAQMEEEIQKTQNVKRYAKDVLNKGTIIEIDYCCRKPLPDVILSLLDNLKPREKYVLMLRYGIEGKEKTYDSIGKELNVTRERVRQIEISALRTLRHPRNSKHLRDYL